MSRSNEFLSNSDVPSIACSAVGSCKDVGPDPIKVGADGRVLTFNITAQPTDMEKRSKFDVKERYEVRDNIFDPRNWKRVK